MYFLFKNLRGLTIRGGKNEAIRFFKKMRNPVSHFDLQGTVTPPTRSEKYYPNPPPLYSLNSTSAVVHLWVSQSCMTDLKRAEGGCVESFC